MRLINLNPFLLSNQRISHFEHCFIQMKASGFSEYHKNPNM